VSVEAGDQLGCAVRADEKVFCWGSVLQRILAGTTGKEPVEFPVEHPRCVAVGYNTACALAGDGHVWCWGYALDTGGSGAPQAQPTQVHGLEEVVQIAVGMLPCALRRSGEVVCWARDSWKPAKPELLAPPTRIEGIDDAVELSAGDSWACARLASGHVSCWELRNWWGPSFQPVDVAAMRGARAIQVGFWVAALSASGELIRWAPSPREPEHPAGWNGAVGLAIHGTTGCLLDAAGRVSCGINYPTGDAAAGARATEPPKAIDAMGPAVGIAEQGGTICALLGTGDVTCLAPGAGVPERVPLPR
jgi:hypothetical protein